MKPSTILSAFMIFAVGALTSAAHASADDIKSIRKIEGMNRIALEDYDLGDYAAAKKRLEEALVVAKEAKIEKHPILATTHLTLGAVIGVGLKDPAKGVAQIRLALQIDPKVTVPATIDTPDVQKLVEQARTAGPAEPATPTGDKKVEPAAPTAPDGPIRGIVHAPIDNAKEGEVIAISAFVGDELKAKAVSLHFRKQGGEYVDIMMKKAGKQEFRAEIPAEATATDSIQYFIDVKNQKSKLVATKGNAGQPFTINVARTPKETEEGSAADDGEDDENPLEKVKKMKL
jgi:hypothetical protein